MHLLARIIKICRPQISIATNLIGMVLGIPIAFQTQTEYLIEFH